MSGDHVAEWGRVKGEAREKGSPKGGVPIRLRVETGSVDAAVVLERVREVFGVVLRRVDDEPVPSLKEWREWLPDWFVTACEPERSKEEAERWLTWWGTLSSEERDEATPKRGWSLADWIFWFEPGEDGRQWTWWGTEIDADGRLRIDIVAESWPTAHGALDWLVLVAGASTVEEDMLAPISHME